jgi:7-carboxy-7-deazaguanine synthase
MVVQCSTLTPLRVDEVFYSLQGESTRAGLPTTFIRLTGCPLRCRYCDTEYAFKGGTLRGAEDLLSVCRVMPTQYVCITGGEPLAQPAVLPLMTLLCEEGFDLSLETSGALSVASVDPRVQLVLDWKAPSSGEAHRHLLSNLDALKEEDQIKFVLGDEEYYRFAVNKLREHDLASRCVVLFSPVYGVMDPAVLAGWLLRDALPVRFQMQMHKALWGERRGC